MAIRITYNSVNIDLLVGDRGLRIKPVHEMRQNVSGSGKTETINMYQRTEYQFEGIFGDAVYYTLWAWWSWARQGKGWSFAMDSANTANTTLDGAAAAAQKVVPLADTTGISAGDIMLLKASDADDEYEVIVVDSVSAGVSITAVSNLVYTYASGDICRHFDYFPDVIVPDGFVFDPEKSGATWTQLFKFIENL